MTNGQVTPCEYARERHRNMTMWLNLWTLLLFVFGVAVVAFLVTAILFFLRESWLPAALSTLGTIVGGVSIKWVVNRRNEALEEEKGAYREVVTRCAEEDTKRADELRARVLGGTQRPTGSGSN